MNAPLFLSPLLQSPLHLCPSFFPSTDPRSKLKLWLLPIEKNSSGEPHCEISSRVSSFPLIVSGSVHARVTHRPSLPADILHLKLKDLCEKCLCVSGQLWQLTTNSKRILLLFYSLLVVPHLKLELHRWSCKGDVFFSEPWVVVKGSAYLYAMEKCNIVCLSPDHMLTGIYNLTTATTSALGTAA